MASSIDQVVSACQALGMQRRTAASMRIVLAELTKGQTVARAAKLAGISESAVRGWRTRYPPFDDFAAGQVAANRADRLAASDARRQERAVVLADPKKDVPVMGLEEFRMAYFGRPTPIHQKAWVKALEDPTNLYVFVLGPPGSGKDTVAGDYVAWEVCPDQSGKRVAWFMESQDFSRRRLGRLARYLTDAKVYDHKPINTPGGAVPARSLIDDFGPFRWETGMLHPDGSRVERPTWTKDSMYFVRIQAPEQDPNLWATGIGGSTYGSRIDVCVCSDIFTVENQQSPTGRAHQLDWVRGTLDTRLDEKGRLIVIGTMLPNKNNYEALLAGYTESARVLEEDQVGPSTYTKFSNGVAVVITKAVTVDPNTGGESSYWPERFPLDSELRHKGKRYPTIDLTDERVSELAQRGATRVRGLKDRQANEGRMFKAMYQQERDTESGGDFTEETLENAKNPQRSFGMAFPHELLIVGVDPARRYGAAWVALAVDRREETVCVVDFFFGDRLGVTGIKQRLILEPLAKWNPIWLCYEINVESAVLDDTLIKEAIKTSGVSVEKITTGRSRAAAMVGDVGSIAAYMRTGHFQVPYRTAQDRARAEILFNHFRAWDSSLGRSKPGRAGHDPDDLAMAARAGFLKAQEMIEKGRRHETINYGVPAGIRRKFDRRAKQAKADRADAKGYRRKPVTALEIVDAWFGDEET